MLHYFRGVPTHEQNRQLAVKQREFWVATPKAVIDFSKSKMVNVMKMPNLLQDEFDQIICTMVRAPVQNDCGQTFPSRTGTQVQCHRSCFSWVTFWIALNIPEARVTKHSNGQYMRGKLNFLAFWKINFIKTKLFQPLFFLLTETWQIQFDLDSKQLDSNFSWNTLHISRCNFCVQRTWTLQRLTWKTSKTWSIVTTLIVRRWRIRNR